ncbi:MAG: tetratricopeptide repeat protein, partial [Bryobacteraceae bacterium]
IYDRYLTTGMGRSIASVEAAPPTAGSFAHAASAREYRVARRGDAYVLRREQPGVLEKAIHYVIGSGNHARSYAHRSATGKLYELPLSWYGYWAMSPGYDRPDHAEFGREIGDACLFCHSAYPSAANRGAPQAIDCQRCHGPGEAHAARRGSVVNPARLGRDRQLDVCLACHLESTSRTLPHAIRRYDRGAFSYRPGEPLASFAVHFDHPAGAGHDDKFEINHAAYRLMKSKCFERSALVCTTCHNPHDASEKRWERACRSCHGAAHEASRTDCGGCHMPKRRTQDAVHVVMTDHWIRRAASPATERIAEAHPVYRGPVAALDPRAVEPLYLAAAQVKEFNNLTQGIPMLERAIAAARPKEAGFYLDLAEAYWRAERREDAVRLYGEAIARDPDLAAAHHGRAETLIAGGHVDRAIARLEPAIRRFPREAALLNTLAVAYGRRGRYRDALSMSRRAIEADPDLAPAWVNLGATLERLGDARGAA